MSAPDDAMLQAGWGKLRPSALPAFLLALSRRTVLGRGSSRGFLTRRFKSLHPSPVDTHLWSSPVRLHPWNNACELKALMRPNQMDAEEHALVARTMRTRPSIFVDIGANVGLFSLHAAISSPNGGRVLAIEPNEELVDRFLYNVALARRHGRISPSVSVETANVALSDFEGEGRFSTERKEGIRKLTQDPSGNRVRVRRLNDVLLEHRVERIDAMKIDIEGHEDHVLPGFLSRSSVELWPRAIIIEHLAREAWSVDCISDCLDRGYKEMVLTRHNTILSYRP